MQVQRISIHIKVRKGKPSDLNEARQFGRTNLAGDNSKGPICRRGNLAGK